MTYISWSSDFMLHVDNNMLHLDNNSIYDYGSMGLMWPIFQSALSLSLSLTISCLSYLHIMMQCVPTFGLKYKSA